ncbi:MAG TPA: hypothetical protein VN729_09960 [Ktedonobacteraceae bacterium]|nr:hypothetical protein [Ktedonobacteraceae bacterium]
MSKEELREPRQSDAPSLLQEKPQRQARGMNKTAVILICLGAVVILGVVLILVWQAAQTPAASSSSPGTKNTTSSANPSSTQLDKGKSQFAIPPGGEGDKPIYWQTLEQQVAQSLHLSPEQIKSKISATTLVADIARTQGISADQLQPIERNAIQKALDQLVAQNIETAQQESQWMQTVNGWDKNTLDAYVTGSFSSH